MRLLIVKTTTGVQIQQEISEKADELIKEYEEQGLLALMLVSASALFTSVLSETWVQNLDLTIQSSEMPFYVWSS